MSNEQGTGSKDIAIRVEGVSKTFKLPHEKHSSLKGLFLSSFRRQRYETQRAVRNVSFDVREGDFFGIVGRNGSGKSTLLKIIAGIYRPTTGNVTISGRLTPFIELGVGFNPELSGRDNVYLNGALFGKSRGEMDALYDQIVEFAELGRFMDQKLKNYSSGMQVRLAFSIAIRIESDILLLDEVLAVGDILFQQKCFAYFHQLKKQHKTVLLVSHDTNVLRQYCNRGILIENGKMAREGPIDDVLNEYTEIISRKEAAAPAVATDTRRRGTGKARVEKVSLRASDGKVSAYFTGNDQDITVQVAYKALEAIEAPVYGIVIRNEAGASIFTSNTLWKEVQTPNVPAGSRQEVTWLIPNLFTTGQYTISPAVADQFGKETYDWVDNMVSFRIRKKVPTSALTNPAYRLDLSPVAPKKVPKRV